MTLQTDKDGTSFVNIKLERIVSIAGAIASIVGVLVFIGGFVTGERYLSSELTTLHETVADLRTGNTATQERLNVLQDRLNGIDNRLTAVSADIKYISQGVAELRLANVPKH
jgi:hypothetical protein